MRNLIRILALICAFNLNLSFVYADDGGDEETILLNESDGNDSGDFEKVDRKGPRSLRLQIFCTLSPSGGVSISGFDNSEITAYEIYDIAGNQIASFIDEFQFIEYLFSLHGEYKVAFWIHDRIYIGNVRLR